MDPWLVETLGGAAGTGFSGTCEIGLRLPVGRSVSSFLRGRARADRVRRALAFVPIDLRRR